MSDSKLDPEKIGLMLAETARTWRNKLDARLKPLGLSQAKWMVLYHLSHTEVPLTQKDLAERLGIEGPTLVGLLNRLSAGQLIERKASLQDRRSKFVYLTPKAKELVPRMQQITRDLRREILQEFPQEEIVAGMHLMTKIKSRIESLP